MVTVKATEHFMRAIKLNTRGHAQQQKITKGSNIKQLSPSHFFSSPAALPGKNEETERSISLVPQDRAQWTVTFPVRQEKSRSTAPPSQRNSRPYESQICTGHSAQTPLSAAISTLSTPPPRYPVPNPEICYQWNSPLHSGNLAHAS